MKAAVSARLADPGAGLNNKPRGMPLALAHDAARPAGDLGHEVGAETLDDLVERTRHGRQRGQPFDQRIGDAAPPRGIPPAGHPA